jgi:hypothetical protein
MTRIFGLSFFHGWLSAIYGVVYAKARLVFTKLSKAEVVQIVAGNTQRLLNRFFTSVVFLWTIFLLRQLFRLLLQQLLPQFQMWSVSRP